MPRLRHKRLEPRTGYQGRFQALKPEDRATAWVRKNEPWFSGVAATLLAIASVVVAGVAVDVSSQQTDTMREQTTVMGEQTAVAKSEARLLAVQSSLVASQTTYMERQLELQSSEMQPVFEVSLGASAATHAGRSTGRLTVTNVGSPVLALSADVFTVSELTVGSYTAEHPSIPIAWPGYFFDTSLYSSRGAAKGLVADFEDESDVVYAAIREWNDARPGDDVMVIRPIHYAAVTYRDIAGENHLVVYEVPPMGGRPTVMNPNVADEVLRAYEELRNSKQVLSWGVDPADLALIYESGLIKEWPVRY